MFASCLFVMVASVSAGVKQAADTSPHARQREIYCPPEKKALSFESSPRRVSPSSTARQELRNDADEPSVVNWHDASTGNEVFVTVIHPGQTVRLQTYFGDRFIIRSSTDQDLIHLDLTVGVHDVALPEGLTCDPVNGAIANPRKPNPPGPLTPEASIRGWHSASACDLIGSWVVFNHSGDMCREIGERWMVDMVAGGEMPHYEITYIGHLFRFKLVDSTVVREFHVQPVAIPKCPTRSSTIAVASAMPTLFHESAEVHQADLMLGKNNATLVEPFDLDFHKDGTCSNETNADKERFGKIYTPGDFAASPLFSLRASVGSKTN